MCFNIAMPVQAHNAHPRAPQPIEARRELRQGDLRAAGEAARPGHDPDVAQRLGSRRRRCPRCCGGSPTSWGGPYQPYHGARLTPDGRAHRPRGDSPPPADRGLPGGGARDALGPRPRGGRGPRAPHLRGARGADRRQAGQPALDPHGDPIPDPATWRRADDSVPLTEARPGDSGDVHAGLRQRRVDAPLPGRALDPAPGSRLTVKGGRAVRGPVMVEIEGRTHALGAELAASMRVERQGGGKRTAGRSGADDLGLVDPVPGELSAPPVPRMASAASRHVLPRTSCPARPPSTGPRAARSTGTPAACAGSGRSSARRSSPPSPTSTRATSPPTSPVARSSATCCSGWSSRPT